MLWRSLRSKLRGANSDWGELLGRAHSTFLFSMMLISRSIIYGKSLGFYSLELLLEFVCLLFGFVGLQGPVLPPCSQ